MILLYWYILIGVLLGCLVTYLMIDRLGFEYLLDDYTKSTGDKLEISFEVFKVLVMFAIILIITFAWPYFAYLTTMKYFK